MNKLSLSLCLVAGVFLVSGCQQSAAPTPAPTIRTLPPAYLSVPHFKKCLSTQQVAGASFWCLPSKKPNVCPESSWSALTQQKLTSCTAS